MISMPKILPVKISSNEQDKIALFLMQEELPFAVFVRQWIQALELHAEDVVSIDFEAEVVRDHVREYTQHMCWLCYRLTDKVTITLEFANGHAESVMIDRHTMAKIET